jgi:hypothetical protein
MFLNIRSMAIAGVLSLIPAVASAEWVRNADGEVWVPPAVTAPPAVNLDINTTGSVAAPPRALPRTATPEAAAPPAPARVPEGTSTTDRRPCDTQSYKFNDGDQVSVHRC